jgi:kinesin family protein 3/17
MNLSFPRKEQDDLQQKLRQLERKLIVGGENLLDKAAKQAQLLEESEQELEKRALNEEQLRKELQQKEVFSYSMIMYLLCFSLG